MPFKLLPWSSSAQPSIRNHGPVPALFATGSLSVPPCGDCLRNLQLGWEKERGWGLARARKDRLPDKLRAGTRADHPGIRRLLQSLPDPGVAATRILTSRPAAAGAGGQAGHRLVEPFRGGELACLIQQAGWVSGVWTLRLPSEV